ncbi:HU domain-containing protein [Mucilaginibacter segetis]|uniref:CCDC81-like prokaryotic HU domain-containing protein n=1 Tax=Mucilaginibacter segetis TaxID=2793071 RepID=A0A934PWF5_9SPHI|nr:hypothetical protein [Mucilaginibacter segetis]MBK0380777.1 hypothetical protein [Mucilaginibacter segetis]
MDVGYYISELLGQHGDVNVPGLGYFAYTRVNGRYDAAESKFYPPGYSVQFDPQSFEDDTLAEYIAVKKNISIASSKYFTEKFITALKQNAVSGNAQLSDLGFFSIEGTNLFFHPNKNEIPGPDFFGFPVIDVAKTGEQKPVAVTEPVAVPQRPKEILTEIIKPLPVGPQFESDRAHEEYLVELTTKRRRKTTWVFIGLALAFTALVAFLIYRYDPSELSLMQWGSEKKAPAPKIQVLPPTDTPKKQEPEKDTSEIITPVAKTDTLAKTTAAKTDTIPLPRWEIMGGTFKTLKEANRSIQNYKTLGVEARIADDVPGPRVHITLGTFKKRSEAMTAIRELIDTKKVSKDIYPLEIKPKL